MVGIRALPRRHHRGRRPGTMGRHEVVSTSLRISANLPGLAPGRGAHQVTKQSGAGPPHPSASRPMFPAAPSGWQPSAPQPAPPRLAPRRRVVTPGRARTASKLLAALWLVLAAWSGFAALQGHPALGGIAAAVDLQIVVLALRIARATGGEDPDPAARHRVETILVELCQRLGWRPPVVVVVGGSVQLMGVRRRGGIPTIFVARAFLDRLGGRELRALLSHELAHLARQDIAAARRRRLLAMLGGLALLGACWALAPELVDYPVWLTAMWAGTVLGSLALGPLNRTREIRADRDAALLCADPEALARALEVMGLVGAETRDRLLPPGPLRWALWPWSARPTTHPPVAERIARIRALAAGRG